MSIFDRDDIPVVPYNLLNDDSEETEELEDFEDPISVYEAAEIWASHGKDEDYMFGYTEEELEDAL